jgi:hypothetical protein
MPGPNSPTPAREATAVRFDNSANQAYTIDLNLASGQSHVVPAPRGLTAHYVC